MKIRQINAYVSPDTLLDGKQESVFPIFREDLAILDPANGYTPIAARGLYLKTEKTIEIPPAELDFLQSRLPHREMIAIHTRQGVLLVFSHLYSSCGLLPAILPHGSPSAVAYALSCLGSRRIELSPAVSALSVKTNEADDIYRHLTELFFLCTQVFEPSAETDFRLHCARVAHLAGCRANVAEFPIGSFPIALADLRRWTAFLLCVFLTLRGDSSIGTALRLENADLREFSLKLSHQSEYTRRTPISDTVYRFLSIPAFAEFQFTRQKDRFAIEARLQRSSSAHRLRAPFPSPAPSVLCIEIL